MFKKRIKRMPMEKELLKVIDMNQAKDFAKVLKAAAFEYDIIHKQYDELGYLGFTFLKFFVEKYIKEPLGFDEEKWGKEIWKYSKIRQKEKMPLEVKPGGKESGIEMAHFH